MHDMDQDFDVGRNVIATLLTASEPLRIYITNALKGMVGSLPSQCKELVGAQVDKLDGFAITECAAYAFKKALARLSEEQKKQ